MKSNLSLTEASRSSLLNQSKYGSDKAKQRYAKRQRSKESTSMKAYNDISMNDFFKQDILTFDIPVQGETDNYIVTLSFGNTLSELHRIIKQRNIEEISYKDIYQAIMQAYQKNDVYFHCTCPDYKYRFAYWSTRNKTIVNQQQFIPSDITNPNDDLGSGCKHSLLVLSNSLWATKVARVIQNYIDYAKKHLQKAYADVIYPAVYDKKYDADIQLTMFDDDELAKDVIDIANKEKQQSTRFKQGNKQGIRFAKNDEEDTQETIKDI